MSNRKATICIIQLIFLTAIILFAPASFSKTTWEDDLSYDVNKVSSAWLYEKLQLPEPYARQAKLALDDTKKFEKVLRDYFLSRPVLKGLLLEAPASTVEQYKKGILELNPNPPVPFKLPMDWERKDLGANFLSQLHSLRYLPALMEGYKRNNDIELFQAVERVFLDWIRRNPYTSPMHPRAWHEGAVAARIRVLLHFLNFYKSTGGPQEASLTLLLSSIYQHAQFLTKDETYKSGGNHGLRQDWGLLAATLAVPEFKHSLRWQELALTRMKNKQINITFSPEGVYLEHSPAYHEYTVFMIKEITTLLQENGLQNEFVKFEELIKKSDRYLTHVLTPLGKFPPVGDSDEVELSYELESIVNDQYLKYSSTSGNAGIPPKELDGFYPLAGEAIFRDTWGIDHATASRSIYIHMHAANHLPIGHRHADELSFVLHGFGRWWILETGKYTYDKNDWREYATSANAHNGYTFNGKGLDSNKQTGNFKDVYFEESYVSTPELAAVRAHNSRFSEIGTKVSRTFVFLRNRKTLVLLDDLNTPKTGKWEAYLHLAPELEVTIDKLKILARAPEINDTLLEIISEQKGTQAVTLVKGQKEPIQGWYSPDYGKIIPSPTLIFDRTGKDGVVSTLLRFRNDTEQKIERLKTELRGDYYYITWIEGDKKVGIKISKIQPLQVQQL